MQSNTKGNQLFSQVINCRMQGFFKQFSIGSLAYRCEMQKKRGVPVLTVLMVFFSMPFERCNIYQFFKENNFEFQRDVVYSFLQSANIGWRLFLQRIALSVIYFFQLLQDEKRYSMLIADTTLLERPRQKKLSFVVVYMITCTRDILKDFECLH